MEILEFPNGICQAHGPKLSVNGEARCLKCESKAENRLKNTPVVVVEDPGHEAMTRGVFTPSADAAPVQKPLSNNTVSTVKSNSNVMTLQEIKEAIYKLPMPKSMKQFKILNKIQALIDQAASEE